ncbi:uncharacterized protein E0L32_003952 [Thyridium curvatum]|uniref:Uncharacterized protein n=1 Tax=Thyridium curvatum TaxID=1093900 RepID=A0A507B9E5_9PEZI|nr:uncharacterized protein E0L32_003952 [Thyridium curvatum]TPX16303.1 hypothetical protein E0L32_003952 [Thyridium curvatum]
MATDFYTQHVGATLRPQADKVRAIFDTANGWEVWAQVELALQMRQTMQGYDQFGLQFGSFERERAMYEGSQQRCDFSSSFTDHNGHPHYHFVELKCLSKGKLDYFVGEVKKDFQKVMGADIRQSWATNAWYAAGWVVAITVDPGRRGGVDARMQQLAQEMNIQWLNSGLTRITDDIQVWTWTRQIVQNGQPV